VGVPETEADVAAREILDSRGNPTVEVDVLLEDGSMGRAAVPSGASTGAHEAVELRDGDKNRYLGKGVQGGRAVNGEIFEAIGGMDAEDQVHIDRTDDRSRRHAQQGAARRQRHPRRVARGGQGGGRGERAAALPLCRRHPTRVLPVPMMNIINGGAHADNPIDFQEFMIMPVGAESFAEAVRWGGGLPHAEEGLKDAGHNTNVGDEGGFAPNLRAPRPRSTSS
jgi:enolase